MAFPVTVASLTAQQSVGAIVEGEAGILDCMAQFWGAPNGVVDILNDPTMTLAKRLELFNSIVPAYANKENSIANVIRAGAKLLAADKNMNPCDVSCRNGGHWEYVRD